MRILTRPVFLMAFLAAFCSCLAHVTKNTFTTQEAVAKLQLFTFMNASAPELIGLLSLSIAKTVPVCHLPVRKLCEPPESFAGGNKNA